MSRKYLNILIMINTSFSCHLHYAILDFKVSWSKGNLSKSFTFVLDSPTKILAQSNNERGVQVPGLRNVYQVLLFSLDNCKYSVGADFQKGQIGLWKGRLPHPHSSLGDLVPVLSLLTVFYSQRYTLPL